MSVKNKLWALLAVNIGVLVLLSGYLLSAFVSNIQEITQVDVLVSDLYSSEVIIGLENDDSTSSI